MVARFGARRPLLWSVCLLIGASAAAGLTASLGLLVAWRAAQGTLGAVLLVAGQAALFAMFPPKRQGLVQAAFALSIVMVPTAAAPALQGWITDTLSWPWVFILNLPVGALGLLVILGGIDAVPDERRPARFDAMGLALLAAAIACLVFLLQEGSRYDWFEDAGIIHLSVVGTAALLLFIGWEVRAQGRGALIDVAVFRDERFTLGFLVSFVAGFALFGSAFVIPAFALQVLSLTPTHAGLLLLPSGALVGIAFLLTYLDDQIALNRGVLAINLTPSNPRLAERQAAAAEYLASRGYNPDEAVGAAVALTQGQVQQQVAVLSFNEAFLAVALLFVVAVLVLITAKLILGRLPAGQHHESEA